MRLEKDSLGTLEVPDEAYYGIHTVRAMENFTLSRQPVRPQLIEAMVSVKKAAALANREAGMLDAMRADAIVRACDEVAQGALSDQFAIDAFQGGAGTSTNMNVNEVLANRANELLGAQRGSYDPVHPIDHVNLHQSTNDVFPTAVRIAAIRMLKPLSEHLAQLQEALQNKEAAFAGILKVGRTELQDAVPVTLGQEFGAFAQAVARDRWRLYKSEERLRQVNLGGTAVGTSVNAPRPYIYAVIEHLRSLTGIGLARAEYPMDATQNCDVFVEVSGLLKCAAVTLNKIASDLRLLSSGPIAGIAEVELPAVQAGSSIMPGKVNPVICEALNQVALQVMGDDLTLTVAATSGQLELNAFMPVIAHNLFEMIELLDAGVVMFVERCVNGIQANEEVCMDMVDRSYGIATALTPLIGYEVACEVAAAAQREKRSIRELVLERGLLDAADLDAALDPYRLTSPTSYMRTQGDRYER